MTEKEFIDKIIDRYNSASNLIEGKGEFDIQRGMAHTISGYVEDLFALYVAQKIGRKDLQYLVDKVVSIRFDEEKRSKSFKPDLMISKNVDGQYRMSHYIDLKTNLGWMRDMSKFMLEKESFIESIKGKYAWVRFGKEAQSIFIEDNIKYHIVVIFGWNVNKETLEANIELAKNLKNIKLNILCTEPAKKLKIHFDEFDDLHKSLGL